MSGSASKEMQVVSNTLEENNTPSTSTGRKGLGLNFYRPLPFSISPKMVLPVPTVKERRPEKKADKRKGKTAVITASPYKLELELEERERNEK